MSLWSRIFRTRKKDIKTTSALEQCVQQLYWGESLTAEQARKNVIE